MPYPYGKAVSSVEETLDFHDCKFLNEVVVKPVYNVGSVGV